MKEQFDKKLAEKIKASFENHQEAYDPKEWDKLAAAYFAKPKGASFPSWAYWAASVAAIAILATSLLFNSREENTDYISKNEIEEIQEDTSLIKKEKSLDITTETTNSKDKNLALEETSKQKSTQIQPEKTQSRQTKTLTQTKSPTELQIPKEDKLVAEVPQATIMKDIEKEDNLEANINQAEVKEHNVKEIEEVKSMAEKSIASALKEEEENKAMATIIEWLSDGADKKVKEEIEKETFEPLKLGVYLMPQTTTTSTQAVNLGAGVITELPVSKRFKIDVGLAYAQQNLVPGTNNRSNVMVAESLAFSDRSAMMSSNFITTTNELSFGQLEIPFNLKYKVFENQKSDIYVISGVSNMFYLNQRNTVTFNTVNLANSGFVGSQAAITTVSETFTPASQNNSRNTGIGQLLNLSVGFEQNLTNGTFLSIEPFYKLSLGNQTFINQQFSIGGLNLRMNFQLKDKK